MGAARASLNTALALKPDYLDAEILLASAELGAGRYGEALKIAQQIQKQYPESASGFVLQGDILMAQKQFAPALKAYEKALAINNNGLIAVKVHQALSAGGNAKEADARLLQWLKDQPNDVTARAYLAATYLRAGLEQASHRAISTRITDRSQKYSRAKRSCLALSAGKRPACASHG